MSRNRTSQYLGKRRIHAWVEFNGVSGAVQNSSGITSVVKNATGSYTVNFPSVRTAEAVTHVTPISATAMVGVVQSQSLTNVSFTTNVCTTGVAADPSAVMVSILEP